MGKSLGRKLKWFKKRRLYKDLNIWGDELRKINKKMTQLVVFSKSIDEAKKIYSENEIINSIIHDRKIFVDFADVYSLLPLWSIIEKNKDSKLLLSTAKEFIKWEHRQIIQPRLEMSLLKVGETFEQMLKNIPGKTIEKTILRPFKLKTTISLRCFKTRKHLRTKNFMDKNERIQRAIEFLNELKKINFDPYMNCFNDPYYNY